MKISICELNQSELSQLHLILMILLVLFSNQVFSFSLEEAYRLALLEDPKLKVAVSTQKAEAEILKQRQSYLLPEITFNAEKGYRNTSPDLDYQSIYDNYGITLSLPIIDVELNQNLQVEELTANKSIVQLAQEQQLMTERLILAYIEVLETSVKFDIAEEISLAAKRRLSQSQETFNEGLTTSSALSEANAAYDLSHARKVLSKGDLQSSWEGLYRLTGLEEPTEIKRLDPSYPIKALQPVHPNVWVTKALKYNFPIKLAQFDLDIAEKQISSYQARFEPTISFKASYENINDDLRVSEEAGRATASLTFSLPLYQGGRFDAVIREYSHRHSAATDIYDDVRRDIKQQVRTLVQSLNNSAVLVLALKRSVSSAKQALLENENNYRVGRRSVEDMLKAESRVHEIKRDYELARYQFVRNQVSLNGLLGELSNEYLAALSVWLSS